MKMINKKYLLTLPIAALTLGACHNGTNDFDDFDYQTVYFANQYADRTIELGVDEDVDLTNDNKHMCTIKAAWGGGYTNRTNVYIDYVVDPSLVDGIYFKNGGAVELMPEDYYILPADNQIKIPQGEIMGGTQVQLTDAFFNDPKSTTQCYVIPLRMTNVAGADSILSGKPLEENPVYTDDSHWSIQPKNFVLYAVKFVNPWHGQYLRRGVDDATVDNVPSRIVRHQQYVENDEVVDITTTGYKANKLPVTVKDAAGNNVTFNLALTFTDDGSCTVGSADDNVVASGQGRFVSKGEKKSLGGKDRDAIYLDYSAELKDNNMKFQTKDTLVLRTRNVYGGATFGVERR